MSVHKAIRILNGMPEMLISRGNATCAALVAEALQEIKYSYLALEAAIHHSEHAPSCLTWDKNSLKGCNCWRKNALQELTGEAELTWNERRELATKDTR